MKERPNLLKRLMEYADSDFYPFHMPGHKRQYKYEALSQFLNPFSIDITEINGFDNLHHPEGILKDSMEWAAGIYGSDKTFYLVNGSSCGILSAIGATVRNRGTILMSRNCHKSAFYGVFLNQLNANYIYPQFIPELGLQGGLLAEDVEEMLKTCSDIEAVLVVSPTYDGVVSDIKAIAQVVHKFGLPLIVDEAHGAHFSFGKNEGFPVSALDLGADIVIQSLHKTLPSLTQTALLHVKKGFVNMERLDRYIQMYQTSSPSYVMMASIENCIRYMDHNGTGKMKDFYSRISDARKRLGKMVNLRILSDQVIGYNGVFDIDISKVIISTRNTSWSGSQLDQVLREQYHLEMEMCGADYVTAITTLADTEEGIDRLCTALLEIDEIITIGYEVGNEVRDEVGNEVRDKVRDVVGNEVRDKVRDVVGNKVRDKVRDEDGNEVRDKVRNVVGNEVGNEIRNIDEDANVMNGADVISNMTLVSSEKVVSGTAEINGEDVVKSVGANGNREIDKIKERKNISDKISISDKITQESHVNKECRYRISEAMDAKRTRVLIEDAIGKVSAEFVYLYPPGIPIAVPGEVLTGDVVEIILEFKRLGLPVQGMEDETAEKIFVMDEM